MNLSPENRALLERYFVGNLSGSDGCIISWRVLEQAMNAAREQGREARAAMRNWQDTGHRYD